jgi:hypothetical protein
MIALVAIAVASFAAEWVYRRWTGRTIKPPPDLPYVKSKT